MNILSLLVTVFGILSFFSVFSLLKALFKHKSFDELQKKAVYESLAISFLIIVILHFLQLVLSLVSPEPFSTLIKIFISPGPYTSWPYKDVIANNSLFHADSFTFDIIVLGVTYYVKRKRYGLI